jgi:hypothetical protein
MQAYVWWDCVDAGFDDDYYNYMQYDRSFITYGGVVYKDEGSVQTGGSNSDGNQECGRYL